VDSPKTLGVMKVVEPVCVPVSDVGDQGLVLPPTVRSMLIGLRPLASSLLGRQQILRMMPGRLWRVRISPGELTRIKQSQSVR